ncbi:MAG: ATP-binding protein [Planctomycetes bacterium]|nr:ATP-binding protein [Planctomycetota bacterium]
MIMPRDDQVTTYYAPAGRASDSDMRLQHRAITGVPLLHRTIDAVPDVVLILNSHRQIVSANRALLDLLQCEIHQVLGRRPGELIGCRNASEGPDGCGTARNCMACGAIDAITTSQRCEDRIIRECRISLQEPVGGALDLKVSATRVLVDDEPYVICVLKDISDEKRLAVLARMFFHDVMNTAGGIQGFVQLLRETTPEDDPASGDLAELAELADQLIEEIQAQRDLTYAESGDLEPEFQQLDVVQFLERQRALLARHPAARGRTIDVVPAFRGTLVTDPRLLGRVVSNMVKNALEAAVPGETVSLRCEECGSDVVFLVHNRQVMPPDVQMQVFQRSFSTKARSGRGIGTHSMKLLGERYLGGEVAFTSRDGEGTTFTITLPTMPHRRTAE